MADATQQDMQTIDRGGHTGLLAAVWLPADLAAQLALPGGEPAEQLHVTLAYCGDAAGLDDVAAARLVLAVQAVAARAGALAGRVGGYGRFYASGSSDGLDVLYANVDVPGLEALRDAVCDALCACGMAPSEAHGYTPHITLKYIEPGAPLPEAAVPALPLRIDALTLAIGERRITLPLLGAPGADPEGPAAAAAAMPCGLDEAVRVIEAADRSGREADCLLIVAGLSQNGRLYPAETLRAAAPLFEGCPAYADHVRPGTVTPVVGRSVRDVVGRFVGVRFERREVGGRVVEGLFGRLRVVAPWLQETLREATDMAMLDIVGLSINAKGEIARVEHDGQMVEAVMRIISVNSVDVVTEPAAGGRIVQLVASVEAERASLANEAATTAPERWTMDETTKQAIAEAAAAAVAAALPGVVAQLAEAVKPAAPAAPTVEQGGEAALAEARQAAEEARREAAASRIERALAQTKLSEPGREFVMRGLMGRKAAELTEAVIAEAVTRQIEYEAKLTPANPPSVVGGTARGMVAGHDKLYKGLQGWFQGAPVDGIPAFRTLQEAYCRWQGIDYFDMDIRDFQADMATRYTSRKTHAALQESLARASWGEVFADNLYVMMIREYKATSVYDDWRMVVSDIEPVPDFQTRHWARVGGYGDLSSVSEAGTYQPLTSPTDEEVTYSLAKYGGLDDVTMEALTDPRGAAKIRRIPQAMARAAKRTLYRDVLDLVTTDNPTLPYDSTALYHANHGNTGTTALSVSGLYTTETAMRDQTAYSETAEILGGRNAPKILIVPNELSARADRIVAPSDAYLFGLNSSPDADTSIDAQRYKGKGLQVITYDYLTDSTDWWAVANPAEVPTVVIGFLNGQQEPELFTQDDPSVGSMFNADKITYKVRIIYGMAIQDHRSFYRQVVAGG